MGFIREPIDVDFTLLSKTWTSEEEKEFSELIIKQKSERKQQGANILNLENERLAPALI